MAKSTLYDVKCTFLTTTPRGGLLIEVDDNEIWLIGELCEIDPPHPSRGDEVTVTMPRSHAVEKGIL